MTVPVELPLEGSLWVHKETSEGVIVLDVQEEVECFDLKDELSWDHRWGEMTEHEEEMEPPSDPQAAEQFSFYRVRWVRLVRQTEERWPLGAFLRNWRPGDR